MLTELAGKLGGFIDRDILRILLDRFAAIRAPRSSETNLASYVHAGANALAAPA
ncbi:hypothetical protein SAMN05216328_13649 [Ensifer sp. YR511]|nr:hypothetical protein SAMN05216328_13649 [Ensifer sp. YR511]